jgi:hypothetical protein
MPTTHHPRNHAERHVCVDAHDGFATTPGATPLVLELLEPFVGPKQRYLAVLEARTGAAAAAKRAIDAVRLADRAFDAAWRTWCKGVLDHGVVATDRIAALIDGTKPGAVPFLAPREEVEVGKRLLAKLAEHPIGRAEDIADLQVAVQALDVAVKAWEAAGRAEDRANAEVGPATRAFDVAYGKVCTLLVAHLGEEQAKGILPTFVRKNRKAADVGDEAADEAEEKADDEPDAEPDDGGDDEGDADA